MESPIINSIVQELFDKKTAEIQAEWEKKLADIERERERERLERERERERLERERQEREHQERERERQQHMLIEALANRFPDVPTTMYLTIQRDIWKITDTATLQQLILEVIKAKDIDDFAHVLKTYADAAESQQ